jgi:hypothetical protein
MNEESVEGPQGQDASDGKRTDLHDSNLKLVKSRSSMACRSNKLAYNDKRLNGVIVNGVDTTVLRLCSYLIGTVERLLLIGLSLSLDVSVGLSLDVFVG